MYLSRVLPWKSSQWVAPPPDEIARIRAEAGTHDAALAEQGEQIQATSDRELEQQQKDSLESPGTEPEYERERRE